MEDINPCYQAALAYLAKGFSVIPIMRGDKKPCIKWQLFQKQLPSIDEVNNWFKTFPDAQVGIVTGKISNLIVIDIDKKTGGLESVKNIHLPVTAIVETGGGGFHYYYRLLSGVEIKNSAGQIAPGIDIRAEGGYVVAPPSIHSSGNLYQWVSSLEEQEIALCPDWLLKENTKQYKNKLNTAELPNLIISEGSRNNDLARWAGLVLSKLERDDYELIGWPWLQNLNEKQVRPPLLEKELRTIFDSIKRSETSKLNNSSDTPVNIAPVLWQEFNKLEFPPERWRINSLIPLQGVVIIASPSGEKKTWLAMEMAKSISLGENFLLYPDFETKKSNVLYIDMEMSQDELQRRGRLLGFNLSKDNIWLLKSDSFNLNNDQVAKQLFEFIQEKSIEVIFVDTLRAVAGGMPEEKAEEVRKFFNRLMPLKNKGVVAIFLDHCRKPLPHEGKVPKKEQLFASQDKVASVEALMMIRSEGRSNIIRVYNVKNRIGKEFAPFSILIEDQGDRTTLSFGEIIQEKETKKIDEAKGLIIFNLKEGPKTRQEILAIGDAQDIKSRNMSDALRQLEKDKIILAKKVGKENQYFLPIDEP